MSEQYGTESRESELAKDMAELLSSAANYEFCMALDVNREGSSVELLLDTGIDVYLDWIKGEGGDIGLLRSVETDKVVGINLPLLNEKLSVWHDGPIKINDGFLVDEQQDA